MYFTLELIHFMFVSNNLINIINFGINNMYITLYTLLTHQ